MTDDRAARHTCHAEGCERHVPPRLFMCSKHWHTLTRELQRAVWREYRDGQEVTMTPSEQYLVVTRQCIEYVAVREGRRWHALGIPECVGGQPSLLSDPGTAEACNCVPGGLATL